MTYFVVAHDAQRREYLVVAVIVAGPADVIGRFDTLADAERDAARWTAPAPDHASQNTGGAAWSPGSYSLGRLMVAVEMFLAGRATREFLARTLAEVEEAA